MLKPGTLKSNFCKKLKNKFDLKKKRGGGGLFTCDECDDNCEYAYDKNNIYYA